MASEFRVDRNYYDGWRILSGIILSLALGTLFGFLMGLSYSCVWTHGF